MSLGEEVLLLGTCQNSIKKHSKATQYKHWSLQYKISFYTQDLSSSVVIVYVAASETDRLTVSCVCPCKNELIHMKFMRSKGGLKFKTCPCCRASMERRDRSPSDLVAARQGCSWSGYHSSVLIQSAYNHSKKNPQLIIIYTHS
jgi:hypothetical protein